MIFTNVIKPTHLCNLNCKYCYNEDVRDPIMRDETLNRIIQQTFQYANRNHGERLVSFIWHGGEPMLVKIPFYEKVVELQKKYNGGAKYNNSIQTNGVLINDQWLKFFKKNDFSVSISIDGTKEYHDRYRVDKMGRGSFDRVVEAIKKVQDAEIPLGACVVVSKANIDHTEEIYDFLAELKVSFNVIPMNRSGGAKDNFLNLGLHEDEYGDAWIKMYDKWFDSDEKYVYCSDFVFKTRSILAGRPADCIGLQNCSDTNISIDPVGDVFACATLSGSQDTKYGNIVDQDLVEIMNSQTAQSYREREIDPHCAKCKWQHVCHGGCLARAYKFYNTHNRRDYYCPSLYQIYEHIDEKLKIKLGDTHQMNMNKSGVGHTFYQP